MVNMHDFILGDLTWGKKRRLSLQFYYARFSLGCSTITPNSTYPSLNWVFFFLVGLSFQFSYIYEYCHYFPSYLKANLSSLKVVCLLHLLNLFVTLPSQFFLSNIYGIPLISFQALIISTYSVIQIFIGHLPCAKPCAKHWGYNDEQRKMRPLPICCSKEGSH